MGTALEMVGLPDFADCAPYNSKGHGQYGYWLSPGSPEYHQEHRQRGHSHTGRLAVKGEIPRDPAHVRTLLEFGNQKNRSKKGSFPRN